MRKSPVTAGCLLLAALACGGVQWRPQVVVVVVPEARVTAASDDYGELTQDGCRLLCGGIDAEELDVVEVDRVVSCDLSPDTADTGNQVDPGEVAVLCSILTVDDVPYR